MLTMLFGLLLVAISAAGFGAVLFGRRPVPQPAISAATPAPVGHAAEAAPSRSRGRAQPTEGILRVGFLRRMLQREPSADRQPAVTFSGWARARSALGLTLMVLGIGTIIGCVITIVVVGAVFVLT